MSFKYINPGYAIFIGDTSQTTEILGYQYSKTGIAFTQKKDYQNPGIYLPNFNSGDDFWAKFDFYLSSKQEYLNICCYAPNTEHYGFYLIRQTTSFSIHAAYVKGNSGQTLASGSTSDGTAESVCGLKLNAINTVLLHVHYGTVDTAYMDITVNDKKFARSENYRAIPYSSSAYDKRAGFYTSMDSTPISNIILSTEEINIKETVIALPISSTETDMTFDSETGIYTATALNQTLLSAVDVESLSNEYGSDSTVTGIALIGNPAYKTANGLTSLTAISKDGVNSVTEFDSISLSDDTSAMILDSFSTDTSIGNLQNYKFGWKAG